MPKHDKIHSQMSVETRQNMVPKSSKYEERKKWWKVTRYREIESGEQLFYH